MTFDLKYERSSDEDEKKRREANLTGRTFNENVQISVS